MLIMARDGRSDQFQVAHRSFDIACARAPPMIRAMGTMQDDYRRNAE
jgi:hypothetical protein